MKLPFVENAIVAPAKVTGYLLSETHESGKDKAVFFLRFGFSVAQWEVMRDTLLAHAAAYEVVSTLDTPHGTHYAVEGVLGTPDNRNPMVRTVWALENGSQTPRLITAYPLKQSKVVKEGKDNDSGI